MRMKKKREIITVMRGEKGEKIPERVDIYVSQTDVNERKRGKGGWGDGERELMTVICRCDGRH